MQVSSPKQWYHVGSDQNVVDVLSRGCKAGQLPIRWFQGPDFCMITNVTGPSKHRWLLILYLVMMMCAKQILDEESMGAIAYPRVNIQFL